MHTYQRLSLVKTISNFTALSEGAHISFDQPQLILFSRG